MCEIGNAGNIVRIFRFAKHALGFPPEKVRELPRSEAVGQIRHQVFERANGRCEYCGGPITENSWPRGEMHEEIPRGNGGEISIENSKAICQDCHRNDSRGHGSRRLRFGESYARNN